MNPVIGTAPSSYGANGPGIDPLKVDSDEFKKFCQYRYPVYAIGYNWLQSNLLSAEDAVKGVDYVDQKTHKKYHLMGIKEICAENKVKKAIIITHSMGARRPHGFSDSGLRRLDVRRDPRGAASDWRTVGRTTVSGRR